MSEAAGAFWRRALRSLSLPTTASLSAMSATTRFYWFAAERNCLRSGPIAHITTLRSSTA
jgi:hypothetical protein